MWIPSSSRVSTRSYIADRAAQQWCVSFSLYVFFLVVCETNTASTVRSAAANYITYNLVYNPDTEFNIACAAWLLRCMTKIERIRTRATTRDYISPISCSPAGGRLTKCAPFERDGRYSFCGGSCVCVCDPSVSPPLFLVIYRTRGLARLADLYIPIYMLYRIGCLGLLWIFALRAVRPAKSAFFINWSYIHLL